MVREALAQVYSSVGDSPAIREDAHRIEAILERERQLCDGMDADAGNFHSLEIHSLSGPERDAAPVEEN